MKIEGAPTVGKLITELQKFPPDALFVVRPDAQDIIILTKPTDYISWDREYFF